MSEIKVTCPQGGVSSQSIRGLVPGGLGLRGANKLDWNDSLSQVGLNAEPTTWPREYPELC